MGLNLAITGGSRVVAVRVASAAKSCFRLSSLGRKIEGVCRTEGADDGGLKTM